MEKCQKVEFNLDESDPKKPKATEVVMEGVGPNLEHRLERHMTP